MSQNPYSASGMQPGGPIDGFNYSPEARTSMMAVASLVLGILSLIMCCAGLGAIAGVPAAGFGIAAIIAINGKQGALSGRGMAVSGIITGTIGLFGTILVWVGVASWVGSVASIFRPVMTGIESADVRAVQNILSKEASAQLNEQRLLDFRKQYQDRLGTFQSVDTNALKFVKNSIKTYTGDPKVRDLMEKHKQVPLVINAKFANGSAQVWLVMPQNVQSQGKADFFVNIIIVPENGESISLFEPGTGTPPTPPANPDPNAAPPASPATPAPVAPKPEQPATPPTGG